MEVAGIEPASKNANRRHLQAYPQLIFLDMEGGVTAADSISSPLVSRPGPDSRGSEPLFVTGLPVPQGEGTGPRGCD
jgi:hypothetical protein